MTPRYGRCEVGKRLIGYAPFGHWKTTTFIAALRHDGLTAPCVFDGAINGEKFAAYIEQELAATLSPGDIVIMDNLSAHKRAAVKTAIEAAQKADTILYTLLISDRGVAPFSGNAVSTRNGVISSSGWRSIRRSV